MGLYGVRLFLTVKTTRLHRTLYVVLLCMMSPAANSDADAQEFRYVDSYGDVAVISVGTDPNRLSFRRQTHSERLVTCATGSLRHCMRSRLWEFALPAEKLELGRRWRTEKRQYSVTGRKTIEIAARKYNVWEIAAEPLDLSGLESHFFFSRSDGLVGFSIPTVDSVVDAQSGDRLDAVVNEVLWLSSAKGLFWSDKE